MSWDKTFRLEADDRLNIMPSRLCRFGIGHLDDALYGILPNDLVVIGADSGAGKSEIGLAIAQYNARAGKKVMLYFLEGGGIEAMARLKWRDIIRVYFDSYKFGVDLDYRKWRMNLYDEETAKILLDIEARVYSEYKTKFKDNLNIYNVTNNFSIDDLLMSLLDLYDMEKSICDRTLKGGFGLDLIVIDHLQYFDLTIGENEIQATTKILKEVKKITDIYRIPVVLISHLRKKGKDRGLPDQEDFYGSSNIPKIASLAITIAPDKENYNLANGIYPTFFRICKSRTGITSNFAIKCDFELRTRTYKKQYQLYRINNFGAVSEEALNYLELPSWAKEGNCKEGLTAAEREEQRYK